MNHANLMDRLRKKRGRPESESLADAVEEAAAGPAEAQPAVVVEKVEAVVAAEAHEKALAPYMDGLPFDLLRITRNIRMCAAGILDATITAGKYLIWVKEELPHGEFLKWADEELGMSRQRASECMRIAQRFLEMSGASGHLRGVLQQLSGGSKSKMMLLLDVTEEEIAEVMETDTFLDKPVDDVASMSYRELQAELRKVRERVVEVRQEAETEVSKRKKAEEELQAARNPGAAELKAPATVLETAVLRALQALAHLEEVAIEYSEEYGDEGLLDPGIQKTTQAFISGANKTVGAIHRLLVPDVILDERRHIPELPEVDAVWRVLDTLIGKAVSVTFQEAPPAAVVNGLHLHDYHNENGGFRKADRVFRSTRFTHQNLAFLTAIAAEPVDGAYEAYRAVLALGAVDTATGEADPE